MSARTARLARMGVRVVVAAIGVLAAAMVLLTGTALYALRAAPGEWSTPARIGPIRVSLSVSALLRVATHPLGVWLLDGRRFPTRHGTVQARAGATSSSLVLRCAPCVVDARELSARPIRIESIEIGLEPAGANKLRGVLRAGRVHAEWQAALDPRSAQIDLRLGDTPVADLVALFGTAVPEAGRARVAGTAGAVVRAALPSGRYTIAPRLDGLVVDGLGTEALLTATPLPACGRSPRARRTTAPYGAWLPKAVIAAEDQRFHEHPGYDLAEMAAAWSNEATTHDGNAARRRGASTISQQVAKMLYVGDERTVARKVRELLYAVELDRTLGKARVLQLYLAVAPWGDGQCGGEAAALHYFGRPAAALDPAEAVWLASLLRNPQAELERAARGGDRERLMTIAGALRPMSRVRREDLQFEIAQWQAPPAVLARRAPRPAD